MSAFTFTWQIWALLAAFFAALTAIFAKVGVEDISPDLATFIRTGVVFVGLFFLLVSLGELKPLPAVSARSAVFLVLSGLATGASWLCYFRALQLGNASQVAPLDKLSIVLVAVFAAVFLGEELTLLNWLGIAAIALGAVLLAWRF
ncbi:EamA family transporter [Afifella pfennigii]|uniref:EamA family transporter n=1 Tax=Afifella pfennigii TaxID=209897 RepID=UPI00047D239B|nr:EamA family transporter [Afifella pfennigii]